MRLASDALHFGACELSLCRRMNCIDARPMKFANLMAKFADERRATRESEPKGPFATDRAFDQFGGCRIPRLAVGQPIENDVRI